MKNPTTIVEDVLDEIITRQRKGKSDLEADHYQADMVLVAFLQELGHHTIAEKFLEIEKWYA